MSIREFWRFWEALIVTFSQSQRAVSLIGDQKSGIIKNDIHFSLLAIKKVGNLLLSCHSFNCPVSASTSSCAKVYLTFHGQGEMSDLRALIRLKEKELRCLEWSLMAQKAQGVAGAFVPENLREELEDCKAEQQVGQTPLARTFYFSSNAKSR